MSLLHLLRGVGAKLPTREFLTGMEDTTAEEKWLEEVLLGCCISSHLNSSQLLVSEMLLQLPIFGCILNP